MKLKGKNIIDNHFISKGDTFFNAYNPIERVILEPAFFEANAHEIDLAVQKAFDVFPEFAETDSMLRAELLETIADEIDILGNQLIERAMLETGLTEARLLSEKERTTNQLRLFASYLHEGLWLEPRIDTIEDEEFNAIVKEDIRQLQIPLGPVAIFTAGNFPLAFSVAGGDSVAALAAGCPVIIKSHPNHPGTAELLAIAVLNAINKCNVPAGIFALIHGQSHEVSNILVAHPLLKACAFTGSYTAGKALYDLSVKRPEPIPFFAEMGSVNPIFFLPHALTHKTELISEGFVNSVNLGVGQFCTNPGLAFAFNTPELLDFLQCLKNDMGKMQATPMMTIDIEERLKNQLSGIEQLGNIDLLVKGFANDNGIVPSLYRVSAHTFINNPIFQEEFFGPVSFFVILENEDELEKVLNIIKPQLTASIHAHPEDNIIAQKIVKILKYKVGRLIMNGFPTGVEVCHAMHHGGPFPATTSPYFSSIGTTSIKRFLRPLCYQNFSDDILPEVLCNNNTLHTWRLINGNLTKKSI